MKSKCVVCGGVIELLGERDIKYGTSWTTGYLEAEAYRCTKCGYLMLFTPVYASNQDADEAKEQ